MLHGKGTNMGKDPSPKRKLGSATDSKNKKSNVGAVPTVKIINHKRSTFDSPQKMIRNSQLHLSVNSICESKRSTSPSPEPEVTPTNKSRGNQASSPIYRSPNSFDGGSGARTTSISSDVTPILDLNISNISSNSDSSQSSTGAGCIIYQSSMIDSTLSKTPNAQRTSPFRQGLFENETRRKNSFGISKNVFNSTKSPVRTPEKCHIPNDSMGTPISQSGSPRTIDIREIEYDQDRSDTSRYQSFHSKLGHTPSSPISSHSHYFSPRSGVFDRKLNRSIFGGDDNDDDNEDIEIQNSFQNQNTSSNNHQQHQQHTHFPRNSMLLTRNSSPKLITSPNISSNQELSSNLSNHNNQNHSQKRRSNSFNLTYSTFTTMNTTSAYPPPTPQRHKVTHSRDNSIHEEWLSYELLYESSHINQTQESPLLSSESSSISFRNDFKSTGPPVGSGISAHVYSVQEVGSRQNYAIKVTKEKFLNRSHRNEALREVKILRLICETESDFSQYILQLKRAWQEDGHLYLQFDLADHGSLQDLMRNMSLHHEYFSERTLWHVLHDVGSALQHVHNCGVIHLDVKPSNILISGKYKLVLADFGNARTLKEIKDTNADGIEGDQRYMATELLSGTATPSADVFSLGITLFEMWNYIPSADDSYCLPTSGQEWHDLREGRIPPLREISSLLLQNVVPQMMCFDHCKRPALSDLLALDRVVEAGQDDADPCLLRAASITVETRLCRSDSYAFDEDLMMQDDDRVVTPTLGLINRFPMGPSTPFISTRFVTPRHEGNNSNSSLGFSAFDSTNMSNKREPGSVTGSNTGRRLPSDLKRESWELSEHLIDTPPNSSNVGVSGFEPHLASGLRIPFSSSMGHSLGQGPLSSSLSSSSTTATTSLGVHRPHPIPGMLPLSSSEDEENPRSSTYSTQRSNIYPNPIIDFNNGNNLNHSETHKRTNAVLFPLSDDGECDSAEVIVDMSCEDLSLYSHDSVDSSVGGQQFKDNGTSTQQQQELQATRKNNRSRRR